MILPILAYGHNILRQPCTDITPEHANLEKLIEDMWDTMHHAHGCGLAASQVGHAIRLFVLDSMTTYDNLEEDEREGYFDLEDRGIKETFINARIIERSDGYWEDNEGCLSVPGVSQKIKRHWSVTIDYYDQNFEKQIRLFKGATARMIQHEYDHTEGILYLDHLSSLTKKLMESNLKRITRGQVKVKYPMKFV